MKNAENKLQNELDNLLSQYNQNELSFFQYLVDTEMSFVASSTAYDIVTKENDTNG